MGRASGDGGASGRVADGSQSQVGWDAKGPEAHHSIRGNNNMANNNNPQAAGDQQQQFLVQQATHHGHQQQNGSTGAASSQSQAASQPTLQHQFQALQHQQILAQQYALHQQGLLAQQQKQLPNHQHYLPAAIQAQLQQGLVAPGQQQQMQVVQQIPQSFVAGNSLPTPAQQRVPTIQQPAQPRPQEQKDVATVAAPNKVSRKRNNPETGGAVAASAQKPQGGPEETTTADAATAAPASAQHPPVASSFTSGISSTAATLIHGALRDSSPDDGNGPSGGSPSNDQPVAADRSAGTTIVEDRRDRNRNNAKATRVRKKAYVNKLKELVDGLHAERNEDARRRRVAVRHLTEVQDLRRRVVSTFLRNHAGYGSDRTAWATILEENFWMKQPVTPYRSFRRSEIQKVRFSRR